MVRFWLTQRACKISLGVWGYFLLRPLRGSSAQKVYHLQASGIWKGGDFQWRIQGRGPGGPSPTPLFLDQTEARSAEKKFGKTALLPCLFQGLDPALISLVEVYKKVRKTVISVWKRPKGLTDAFHDSLWREEVEKTFFFCDLFMFERQCMYRS